MTKYRVREITQYKKTFYVIEEKYLFFPWHKVSFYDIDRPRCGRSEFDTKKEAMEKLELLEAPRSSRVIT